MDEKVGIGDRVMLDDGTVVTVTRVEPERLWVKKGEAAGHISPLRVWKITRKARPAR